MININGSNDNFYRYKMEKIKVINKGNGNGLLTTITNLEKIAKSINTPYEVLCKYITIIIGSSYDDKKKTFTGNHSNDKIQKILFDYIGNFVICKKCNIPELTYQLINNNEIQSICSACGNINCFNPLKQKGGETILKYLQQNKIWLNYKGNMVLQNNNNLKHNNIIFGFNSEEFGKEVDDLNINQDDLQNDDLQNDDFNPFT